MCLSTSWGPGSPTRSARSCSVRLTGRHPGGARAPGRSLKCPPRHAETTWKGIPVEERAPTLLVIEDARDQAILVGVAARRAHPGLEVHIAEDGQQGIDYLSGIAPLQDPPVNPVPDLVILDLEMPVVDGFGVLEWLRETPAVPLFPVVVLTASQNPDYEKRALELGATEVHQKPTELAGLGSTVKQIVKRWIDPRDIMAAHMRTAG